MTIKAVRDVGAGALEGEEKLEQSLRPATFDEYVGQEKLVDNFRVYAKAARGRGEALDHVLLSGPPPPRWMRGTSCSTSRGRARRS